MHIQFKGHPTQTKVEASMHQQKQPQKPYILNKQAVLSILQFTPISAFLSVAGVFLVFTVQPTSPLPFLLILTPLYINTHSYILGICLIISSLIWPNSETDNYAAIRVSLIVNAIYMMISNNRNQKYRMLPSKVLNQGIPILL